MSAFEDAVIQRIKQLEREVERLQRWERPADVLGLRYLTDPAADRVLFWDDSAGALKWLTLGTGLTITDTTIKPSQPQFYPLDEPFVSTSWDGDSYSTVSTGTSINLQSVFGAPSGVKAIYARITARDSATYPQTGLFFQIGSKLGVEHQITVFVPGSDVRVSDTGICKVDADGNIYYKLTASGTNTMDCWIYIWGYWL